MPYRLSALAAAFALVAVVPAVAQASQLIDRNASNVQLAVSPDGKRALLTYGARGALRRVLLSGAINARHPTARVAQVKFALDYSGGRGRPFRDACLPYDGPALAWLVTACKAPDGSYWAVQSWRRLLPALGFAPWLPSHTARELRVSHWRGPLAKLEAWRDWRLRGAVHGLFGRLTYGGRPVYGFGHTRFGSPRDGYGRNLYLDTYNSAYGRGWRRENGFLAHRPSGVFCYAFWRFRPVQGYDRPSGWPTSRRRPPGNGQLYRITVIGPGVTPDVVWTGTGLPRYNPRDTSHVQHELQMNALLDRLAAGNRRCRSC